ncbi:unnamed protein product, partial [Iphiclides podalirius]
MKLARFGQFIGAALTRGKPLQRGIIADTHKRWPVNSEAVAHGRALSGRERPLAPRSAMSQIEGAGVGPPMYDTTALP